MNKFLLAASGAAALVMATGAQAQVVTGATSTGMLVTPVVGSPNSLSFGYVESGINSPFAAWLEFSNALSGVYSIALNSSTTQDGSANDTDFDPLAVYLTGPDGTLFLLQAADHSDLQEHYVLNTSVLASGNYRLDIGGTSGNARSFGGNIAFSAVPEPSTWGMMLIGFGVAGAAMRRRRRESLLPQIA